MKTLKQYISEWRLTSDNVSNIGYEYNYKPNNTEELIDLILKKCAENEKNPYLLDIDTSKITDMEELFYLNRYVQNIEILDLHTWNVSKVETMKKMFYNLKNLKSVNTIGWNTSNVTTMYAMFDNCHVLKEITGIEMWNTKSVTDVIDMFADCHRLESLDFKNWDVSGIEHMSEMFWCCEGLKKINNIENWVITSYSLNAMFRKCVSLEYLDISNWTFKVKLDDASRMFQGCVNLKEIKGIDTLKTARLKENMFEHCNSSIIPSWY